MVNTIFRILAVLIGVACFLILLAMRRKEKAEKRKKEAEKEKREEVRREAKKLSLEKYKDIYEKAIKEIDERILKESKVEYEYHKMPFFVVEAIVQHFRAKGWSVEFRPHYDDIIIHVD